MAKISVAMAVYNGEKYLAKQLDSILNQLEATDEIVASYDKSTDNSLALLEDYAKKDPRVKVFINENKGVAGNFGNAVKSTSRIHKHPGGDSYLESAAQLNLWKILSMLMNFITSLPSSKTHR